MMELRFLGTAAAEQVPSIYCRCDFCNEVRRAGGKDQRTRSSFRIGTGYQIDFGPDANWQMHRCGTDMFDVEHLLITHTHSDHFQFEEIVSKSHAVASNGKPLKLYMSIPASEYLESIMHTFEAQIEDEGDRESFKKRFPVIGLQYFQRYEVGELAVETIKACHRAEGANQFGMNYLIHLPDGRQMLYALDTGYYAEDTWEFLDGRSVDILAMDCTFPGRTAREPRPFGHHSLSSFIETLQRMRRIGFLTPEAVVYATHFDPHQALSHNEIQARLSGHPFSIVAAYDGLRI